MKLRGLNENKNSLLGLYQSKKVLDRDKRNFNENTETNIKHVVSTYLMSKKDSMFTTF
jgi:hypothetical protein